jgi:hypothetical protein
MTPGTVRRRRGRLATFGLLTSFALLVVAGSAQATSFT